MSLAQKYPAEVAQILAKYPPEHKRSAVMPLLYLAQRDDGYVTKEAMRDIAGLLDINVTEVGGVVGFYTLYHDKQEGKYRMQVCTDLPCALRGAEAFLKRVVREPRGASGRDEPGRAGNDRGRHVPGGVRQGADVPTAERGRH